MAPIHPEVEDALSHIEGADMRHPSALLLSSFITEALYPVQTARYVNDRLLHDDARSILSDWVYIVKCMQNGDAPPPPDPIAQRSITRRDGGKCCVTGKAGIARDPLLVSPILPIPSGWMTDNPRISDMLGAFFGPPYRDWWFLNIKRPEESPLYNHWLVRKSAASALAQGLVRLDRQPPSTIEYEAQPVIIGPEDPIDLDGAFPLLGDHSRSRLATVDPRYVGTHARLSRSFRFVNLAQEIAPGILLPFGQPESSTPNGEHPTSQPSASSGPPQRNLPNRPSFLTDLFVGAFLTVWLWFPIKARMAVYDKLRAAGQRRYGMPYGGVDGVQKLPFNLYLKFGTVAGMAHNEFNALQMVRRHTKIPAPRVLDVFTKPDDASKDPYGYLLMTGLPGVSIDRCQDILSDRDLAAIAAQMKDYVSQLRGIPKTVNPDKLICNTLGQACRDHRIRYGDPIGPFADEAAFSQFLRFPDEDARRGHEIVFTHADLNPRNILVDKVVLADGTKGWRVTGIVDWETAGYYPEYWDYTKAFFERFRWTKRYNDAMHGVFNSFADYSREFDVELRAWESGDGC
ncbi:kinase-like domain-containing protein [Podospora appendiculata]|uniref:Kinase-like domain-containing protein n=1 Tax=Podospora appendiculata TaxID=314037 RepID=A0AAE1C8L8_9PEZI|nr:kinase-like domain-containing protein [Podospora appendiculata]